MARNYVTNVVGDPYVRVDDFRVRYSKPMEAFIVAQEQEAILLRDGSVKQTAPLGEFQIALTGTDFAETFERIDLETDTPLGEQRTVMDLLVDLGSFLRKYQKLRDAAAAAAEPVGD